MKEYNPAAERSDTSCSLLSPPAMMAIFRFILPIFSNLGTKVQIIFDIRKILIKIIKIIARKEPQKPLLST